jgi:shikimate dehydrogenase
LTTYLGVCGWPVAHSRSPAMQNAGLQAAGLTDWQYLALPLPPALFAETVRALPAAGFRGVNATIPHKEAALEVADVASPAARAIGAANTLTFEPDGAIVADNTDAPAVIELVRGVLDPAGRSALVLGAGGGARAAVWALVQAGAQVEVWGRTPARAEALAESLGARYSALPGYADIVVNATSVGLDPNIDPFKAIPLKADTFEAGSCVIDMVYGSGETQFLTAARSRGARVIDGLEMLLAQGVASFERWTGMMAPRMAMREAVATSPSP